MLIIKGDESFLGNLVDVKITNSNQNTLFGETETNLETAWDLQIVRQNGKQKVNNSTKCILRSESCIIEY